MHNRNWLTGVLTAGALAVFAAVAYGQAAGKLEWAYPNPDKNPPPAEPQNVPKKLPGSTKSYTQAQIDDQFNPPTWCRRAFRRRPAVPAI